MHDPLESTFDHWYAEQAGGAGLRVGLPAWRGGQGHAAASPAQPPTATLSLQKSQAFADRYVRGLLEDARLTVSLRLGFTPRDEAAAEGAAYWRDARGDRPMSTADLASLGALAVREAYHAGRDAEAATAGFVAFSRWLLTALEADCGSLVEELRRLEPRVFWWWGRALEVAGHMPEAERSWTWQTGGRDDRGPVDAAVHCLLKLAHGKTATPADRLGFCRRAQRLIDHSAFRDFDLQTHLDVARAAALIDLRYRAEALEQLQHVERRLIANPCGSAARQAAKVTLLTRKAGGFLPALRITLQGLVGVAGSATARFKARRALAMRRLRSRRPRLPQGAAVHVGALTPAGRPLRIALVRLDRMGDLVTMQPIVRRVRDRFPDADIDLYVSAGLEPLAEMLAERVRGVGIAWAHAHRFAATLEKLRAADRYDLLIDLLEPDVSRQLKLMRALPAAAKVSFDSPGRREHATHRIPTPARPMHLIDRTAMLLRPLGQAVPDDAGWVPQLRITPHAKHEAEALLRDALGDGPWLGLHIGAGWKFKRWYPEAFARVGRALAEKHGLKVAVFCGADERAIADSVAAALGPSAAVITPTLAQLPAMCAACRLMLVNDSGPMHIAAAVGVPTVVAWGPGDRSLFSPRCAESNCIVVADQPRCANCPQEVNSTRCPMGFKYEAVPCLQGISEAAVLAACEELL